MTPMLKVLVTQSCLTLPDPMDYSPPGSSVHRIIQSKILEWVAISFSRGSSLTWVDLGDWTWVSCIRVSLIAQLVKNPPAMQVTPIRFLDQEDPLEKGEVTHSSVLGFLCGSAGKESACNSGDLDSIPGLGRSPGEGKGFLLQYSGLENSMDCIVHGVINSWTQLRDFHSCLTGRFFTVWTTRKAWPQC